MIFFTIPRLPRATIPKQLHMRKNIVQKSFLIIRLLDKNDYEII
jgi:hypothetical protein